MASKLRWIRNSVFETISAAHVNVDGPLRSRTVFWTPLRLASSSPRVTFFQTNNGIYCKNRINKNKKTMEREKGIKENIVLASMPSYKNAEQLI